VILPAALVGLWLTRRRRELWPLRVFLVAATALLVPFFLFERFRMPLTALALPFAAHAGVACVGAVRRGRRVEALIGLSAAGALGLVLGLPRVHRDREVLRVNIGGMFLQAGRYDDALREFEAVRAASPAAWRVGMNIATTQALQGRSEEALRTLDALVPRLLAEAQRTGRPPVEELLHCYALAGDLHMALGRPQQALAAYEAAARWAPDHPQLRPRLQDARARLQPRPGP
jgi:tetratricopeptide (TPR) repeat protein